MTDSVKRRVEEVEDALVKKARADDVAALLDIVVARERKMTEAWTQIVADLHGAGIRKCDHCFPNDMKWTRGKTRYVQLKVWIDHSVSTKTLVARYEIHCTNNAGNFHESHWKGALQCLKNWIEAMDVDLDRERITSTLRGECDAWDSFLKSFPNDKIPAYSEYSFMDGHLVLEWHGENGRVVTLDRVPCPAYDDENGEPGVYKDGRLVSFRVSKSPDRPLNDKTERVFVGDTSEVIAKIAEFLQ